MKTYTLENEFLSIEVLNQGAKLLSFKHKSDGVNMVVRYEDIELYKTDTGPYLGSTIGPVAGRVGGGKFGEHQLSLNTPPNQLHSGFEGLHMQEFNVQKTNDSLIFENTIDHSRDGFPGTIQYRIEYKLKGETLELDMKAYPSEPMYLNLTNHSYFNLDGSETIYEHSLKVASQTVSKLDETLLYYGDTIDVQGTTFDFRTKKTLRACLESDHEQYAFTRSLDHYYSVPTLQLYAGNKSLKIETNAPGFQFYAANYFDETFNDEYGRKSKNHAGLAIEPQRPANEVNITKDYPLYSKTSPFEWKTRYSVEFE